LRKDLPLSELKEEISEAWAGYVEDLRDEAC
jgi:hypothetical protein